MEKRIILILGILLVVGCVNRNYDTEGEQTVRFTIGGNSIDSDDNIVSQPIPDASDKDIIKQRIFECDNSKEIVGVYGQEGHGCLSEFKDVDNKYKQKIELFNGRITIVELPINKYNYLVEFYDINVIEQIHYLSIIDLVDKQYNLTKYISKILIKDFGERQVCGLNPQLGRKILINTNSDCNFTNTLIHEVRHVFMSFEMEGKEKLKWCDEHGFSSYSGLCQEAFAENFEH